MIQFNLLPDVKLAYIRAKRRKRIVTVISSSVIASCLTVLVLLFAFVNIAQKQHLSDLSKDINSQVKELQDTQNLDSILTVQNQLMVLDGLHDKKPLASRLFNYLTQVTPAEINITKLDVDFQQSTMKVTGSSKSLNDVNKFADTLKFTNFTIGTDETKQRAFSNVVLSSFGRTDTAANFAIDFVFDPAIFDNAKDVKLVVPDTITTRSETEKPLFQKAEETP
jgi:Tfp pilus assembly protein PilN